jgi:hypothetical protein
MHLPRPADQPESNSTLPHPELNPLVNPLLGQNMGRWAEVYFTSPPEKREEAVLNLLRELEEDASAPASSSIPQPRKVQADEGVEELPPHIFMPLAQAQAMERELVPCQSCGTKNPAHQKFCGQCGTLLRSAPTEAETVGRNSSPPLPPNEPGWFSQESAHGQSYYNDTQYKDPQAFVEAESEAEPIFAANTSRELEWLRDVAAPKLMPEYEPAPYRYRIYVGAALALLIAALVYISWRGAQAPSGNSHALPQAAPGATEQPPAQKQKQNQTPAPPPRESSAKGGSQNNKAKSGLSSERSERNEELSHATTSSDDTARIKKASTLTPVSASVAAQRPATTTSPQDDGGRELAVAQNYLSSAPGRVRDSTEAAKWLWQAVRKENPAATLILSDLYLRGDGVPKSCDQGRLLLNAAGRRGVPGAGERIRNLQAFGCQ